MVELAKIVELNLLNSLGEASKFYDVTSRIQLSEC